VQWSPVGVRIDFATLAIAGLAIPLIQEAVKPLPALLLRRRPEFGETVDGLVFGVAAGLGFALAQTIVQFSQVLTTLDVRTDPANWLPPLISAAVLHPILHGSSTGAIAAAIWRLGRERRGALEIGAIIMAVLSHVAFIVGSLLIQGAGLGLVVVVLWQVIVVGAMLVYVRYLLHDALLDEASNLGFARTVCPNCHRSITAAGFCPSCGMALTAVPQAIRDARVPDAGAEGAQG
jgi:RsiW-degrading membrane proteinase PrsW (M82 family)